MGQRKNVKRRSIGILDLLIAQAHDVPNRMPSNGPYTPRQDVYVQVFGGRTPSKQNLKTRKAKEAGSEPVFNETMQVCILEGDVELTCQVWMASYSRGSHLDVMLAYAHIPLGSFLHRDPCRKLKNFALTNSEKPNESGGVISLGLKFHPNNVSALDRQAEAQGCTPSRPPAVDPAQLSPAQPQTVKQEGSLLASLRAALGRHTADSENNVRGSKRSSPEPTCDDSPLIFIAGSCDLSRDENEGLEKRPDRFLKKGRPLGLDIEAELKKVVGEIVIPQSEDGESYVQSSAKGSPWSQSEVLQGSQFQRENVPDTSVGATIQTTVSASQDLRFGSLTIPDLDFECEESPRTQRNLSSREKKVLEDLKIGQRGEGSNLWQKDLDSPGVLCLWGETEQVIAGGLEEVFNLAKAGGGMGMVETDSVEGVCEFDFHSYANQKDPAHNVSPSLFEGEYVMESCESIGSVKQSNLSFGSEGELEGEMKMLASQVVTAYPVTPVSEKYASRGQRQLLWQRRMQKNERKRGKGGYVKDGKRRCDGVRGGGEHWQTLDNTEFMTCTASTLQEQYSRNLMGREMVS